MRCPRRHSAALTVIKRRLLLSAVREETALQAEGEGARVTVQRLSLSQLGGGILQSCQSRFNFNLCIDYIFIYHTVSINGETVLAAV